MTIEERIARISVSCGLEYSIFAASDMPQIAWKFVVYDGHLTIWRLGATADEAITKVENELKGKRKRNGELYIKTT